MIGFRLSTRQRRSLRNRRELHDAPKSTWIIKIRAYSRIKSDQQPCKSLEAGLAGERETAAFQVRDSASTVLRACNGRESRQMIHSIASDCSSVCIDECLGADGGVVCTSRGASSAKSCLPVQFKEATRSHAWFLKKSLTKV